MTNPTSNNPLPAATFTASGGTGEVSIDDPGDVSEQELYCRSIHVKSQVN